MKPLRDEIARWLGLDDADDCISWEYGQHQTRGGEGVAVKVESVNERTERQTPPNAKDSCEHHEFD